MATAYLLMPVRTKHSRLAGGGHAYRPCGASNGVRPTPNARAQGSVTEEPAPGEDHGDAVLVRRGDHFLVADGAAGVDDGADPGLRRGVHAVAEGEEGIRGQRRPRQV